MIITHIVQRKNTQNFFSLEKATKKFISKKKTTQNFAST